MFTRIFVPSRTMMRTSSTGGCASHASGTYEEAVRALNGLQSNATYLRNNAKSGTGRPRSLDRTEKYLTRSGFGLEELDKLSVIHVAGTKGKGSTCAFTECLLRSHGVRTGLYTSPHLISVRERLRINGEPIDESKFARYFWTLYERLEKARRDENDMPQYFNFLTLLMFHVFANEPIDVAIIEVGIGGEHDCTNVVRNPVCVGITSLGLDHVNLLGDTLEEIAREKSGILKSSAMAFTVPQPSEAMEVLKARAIEKGCSLIVAPPLENYGWSGGNPPVLGIPAKLQSYNASLAISLASSWMSLASSKKLQSFWFDTAAVALSRCRWPGRTQILRAERIDYYLDGAHTLESVECGAAWFDESTSASTGNRILIFNATGDRDSLAMLNVLRSLRFDAAYFVPNVAGKLVPADQINYNYPSDVQRRRSERHREMWGEGGTCAANVAEALDDIRTDETNFSNGRVRVLVTGSLHLVGAALSILDPDLSESTRA